MLEPFYTLTLLFKGRADAGYHGVIWEALPTLEILLNHLEGLMCTVPADKIVLRLYIQQAWEKLKKYYNRTDENYQIYAAATLLNPCLRKQYFYDYWTRGELPGYI